MKSTNIGDDEEKKEEIVKSPKDLIAERLYTTPKWTEKKEKGPDDSLVCDLPSTTLRWMKKRRKADSDQKVVLSYQRERQLREMFRSLDYLKQGEIDLSALTEAVAYVQEKTKHMKGMKAFQNLHEVFAAMDDNGDGTIDFQEFTNGMTGTTQSAFDKASEYDIERLFRFFVEFGELRQRQIALKTLNMNATKKTTVKRPEDSENNNNNPPGKITRGLSMRTKKSDPSTSSLDLNSYQQFKVLFGHRGDEKPTSSSVGTTPSHLPSLRSVSGTIHPSPRKDGDHSRPGSSAAAAPTVSEIHLAQKKNAVEFRKLQQMETLLDEFIHETYQPDQSLSSSYRRSRMTYHRIRSPTKEDDQKMEEYLKIQEKLKELRKEEVTALARHYNDVIFIEQRAQLEKK